MAENAKKNFTGREGQGPKGPSAAAGSRTDSREGQADDSRQPSGRKKSFQEILEARREQMKEITDRLEAGLKEYMTTDVQFKKVLDTMSKFHHYSANNVLLIAMQMPTATHVASYTNWKKKFNRQVMKGQHGLSIIAPAPYKKKTEREVQDPRTGRPVLGRDGNPVMEEVEITIPRYKVTKVFDLSQTVGAPLPELDVPELTGTAENYEIFMDAMRAVSPVPIRFDVVEGGAKGYYDNKNKEIVIREGMSEVQTMKTAVHEVSHARLHDRDAMQAKGMMKDQRTKELEAESIAYVVMSHYQMDTSDYSIPYLASWSGSQDTAALRASMDTIRKTASEIFDEVEAYVAQRDVDRYTIYQIEDGTPAADYSFMDLDFVREQGYSVSMDCYREVFRGYLRPDETLESLYEKFNRDDRPAADRMHSMSVSDVVVLHKAGEDHAYYVDAVGFPEIPEFFLSQEERDQVKEANEQGTPPPQRQEDSREQAAKTDIPFESALTFYVAENMDFPVMGQYHECHSLAEAVDLYRKLPPGHMDGGKGIGCVLHDENGNTDCRLVVDGQVVENPLEDPGQRGTIPALTAAVQEAKTYFPEHSTAAEHEEKKESPAAEHVEKKEAPAAEHVEKKEATAAEHVERKEAPAAQHGEKKEQPAAQHGEKKEQPAAQHVERKDMPARKESVLAALRAHQKEIGKADADKKDRPLTPQKKKGELSL